VTPLPTGVIKNTIRQQKVFESAKKEKLLNIYTKKYIMFDKNGKSQFTVKSCPPIILQETTHVIIGQNKQQHNTVNL